jgi:hypothetical protein
MVHCCAVGATGLVSMRCQEAAGSRHCLEGMKRSGLLADGVASLEHTGGGGLQVLVSGGVVGLFPTPPNVTRLVNRIVKLSRTTLIQIVERQSSDHGPVMGVLRNTDSAGALKNTLQAGSQV